MELNVMEQTVTFFQSVLSGLLSGMLYEFFKCFKLVFLKNKIARDISDILFVVVLAVFLFFAFFSICGLGFRIYHILGLSLGIILFFFTVNKIIFKIFEKILKIFKEIFKILLYPVKFFSKIVLSILVSIFKVVKIPWKYISEFYFRIIKSFRNIVKRKGKV